MRTIPALCLKFSADRIHKLSHAFVTYIFPDASGTNRVPVRAFSRKPLTTLGVAGA